MCYFVFGSINPGVDTKDYQRLADPWPFLMRVGSAQEMMKSLADRDYARYRAIVPGENTCDCGSGLGCLLEGEADRWEMQSLTQWAEFIDAMRGVRGARRICLANCLWEEGLSVKSEEEVLWKDVDPVPFLGTLKNDCLYTLRFDDTP